MLISVLLFSVCACSSPNGGGSDTEKTPESPEPDILATATPAPNPVKPVEKEENNKSEVEYTLVNIIDEKNSTFDSAKSTGDLAWKAPFGGKLELTEREEHGKSLTLSDFTVDYATPAINMYPYIKEHGAGDYSVQFEALLEGDDLIGSPFTIAIRGSGAKDENTFIMEHGGNYYYTVTPVVDGDIGDWQTVSFEFTVEEEDIDSNAHTWNLCVHHVNKAAKTITFDNVQLGFYEEGEAPKEKEVLPVEAQTWLANEITLVSEKEYKKPVADALLDLKISNGKTEYTVPGFWDGGTTWRIRFMLPEAGTWTYETVCSDASNTKLHGRKGTVNCTAYTGDLDIYKHGFIKTEPNTKYFMYNDGTPFFYLGDTHWNFLTEEYDSAGTAGKGTDIPSHFKYIINKRVSQGYTVYQTEPIGASFDITNGINQSDIPGFQQADKYFAYIAKQGLVHANAQFFFPSSLVQMVQKDNYEELLEQATRYWVARWSCYPVLWTLGQEVDNEAYFLKTQNGGYALKYKSIYPYKLICEWLDKYDPYKHPISAHQEGSSDITKPTAAFNSDFLDVKGHTWWATQWKPRLNQPLDFSSAVDYYTNGQGKPIVMYEGRYDSFWTNEWGARVQGWISFLNGMCGHGYGATDMWLYNGSYDMENDTVRDDIRITVAEKRIPWTQALELPAGYQMQYMKEFFEKIEWWKLVPCFANKAYFSAADGIYYSAATIDGNGTYVAYFYDLKSKATGTLNGLDASSEYTYQWFNPRTNVISNPKPFKATNGSYDIGERPSAEDWVFIAKKK